ncbi:MAG: mitochondrial large ribosomal subunit protein uL30m [Scytolyngbya sp. HA4215-MV1]|nr:mitochondrial large ribosomal subunit protein uL30m [Scytolyngbya sp. HA4215-MV1]
MFNLKSLTLGLIVFATNPVLALPPPQDTPEEILRTEIILDARSPIDGKPLTAAEYAELEALLQTGINPPPAQVSPKVRKVISLLRLRRFFKTFLPFIPIK